ncbi:hypothetical protein [Nocardia sp. NPDC052566]|uniref:hypothetical protein n=1 Tax=Nocardia sp. NPDC052566 TaxID=3364330 RepID=UPI0037C7503B
MTAVDDPTGNAPAALARDQFRAGAFAALGPIIMVLLVVDAVITLALEVLFLPLYLGTLAFPVSALLAGVINVLLLLGMRSLTDRLPVLFLPLGVWAFGFLFCLTTGPGGDVMLGSDWRTLLLLVCGLLAPLAFVYARINAAPRRGR